MAVKILLKNSPKTVIVDDDVYEYVTTNDYLTKVEFISNLRLHSSGCAVFQKSWKKTDGTYKTETIYLHKLVAQNFIPPSEDSSKKLVLAKNGNMLDCRVKNLKWCNRSEIKRNISTTNNKTGYIGVTKDRKTYRAIIYFQGKPISLGNYKTPEEAAEAYNKKSIELFGKTRSLNKIKRNTDVRVSTSN